MVDILKIGANSLVSIQHAMNTAGHNIANANTEGYSRQTVNFETNGYQNFGFGFVGQGARIQSVERSYDSFLTTQVQDFSSSESRYQTFLDFSSRVDNILANSENSLNTSLQKFFSSVQDVAANPSTLPERQVMIGEANNLVDRQQNFKNLLEDLNSEVNIGISTLVTEVNGLAGSISSMNTQIVSAFSTGNGAPPNDLLDQRDALVKELAQKVGVTTIEQDDGALNVFIGKGQALVVGSQPTYLKTTVNPYDSSRLEVGLAGQINVNSASEFISGGQMQGLLDFRARVLQPAQMQLGLISAGLSETINAQHKVGLDLNGDQGVDFFQSSPINVAAHTANAGTAEPIVTLNDVSSLRASDYSLMYDGSQWQLTQKNDGTSVSGDGSTPLVLDGMSIDVSTGVAVAGDSYIINPARDAAGSFNVNISDPRKIAAAAPVVADNSINNNGNGVLSGLTVSPEHTLPLATSITLTFNPDALGAGIPGFDVTNGLGPLAYDPNVNSGGQNFEFNSLGISFKIADKPQAGDTFIINNNVSGIGDNSNILNLGELQHQSVLNGGKDSYQEFYGSMVAQVGVTNRQASANLSVETTLLQQAEAYRDSVSGVNLDEEAANLIRFQQSYQAAAKLIQVADELFQTLISSLR